MQQLEEQLEKPLYWKDRGKLHYYFSTEQGRITRLWLGETSIHDLPPIRQYTHLKTFDLTMTNITNITPLQNLTNLKKLDLEETKVTKRPLHKN